MMVAAVWVVALFLASSAQMCGALVAGSPQWMRTQRRLSVAARAQPGEAQLFARAGVLLCRPPLRGLFDIASSWEGGRLAVFFAGGEFGLRRLGRRARFRLPRRRNRVGGLVGEDRRRPRHGLV
ncbi:hypothetical protein M885DRAFT_83923 [Pelagophyceae sp. CCMP2097]|nr:hypothetical protein M885DRAFT_83923 [Pelagophyceae sp. CCMP2097]